MWYSICRWTKVAKGTSSLSLCVYLIVSLHSHSLISWWPDPWDSVSPFTLVKWSQHSGTTQGVKQTFAIWVGFIINTFWNISLSSCGFSSNRFTVSELNFKRSLDNTIKIIQTYSSLIVSFYILHGSLHRSIQINVSNYSYFHQRV